MNKILSLIMFVLFTISINAQTKSPYQLNLGTDITLPTVSIAMIGTAFLLERKRSALSVESLNSLDRNSIRIFDRNATYNWNTNAAKWSDGLMLGTSVLPLMFLIDKRSRNDYGKVATIYTEIFLLNTALTNLTKELVQRKRPYVYNPNAPLKKKLSKDATHSFFSGHVSFTASMSFGFAQMYSAYNPNSKALPAVWFASSVLPLAVGILRNRAGKHFWTDIIVGYVVGASVGLIVPQLHKANL